MRLTFHSAQTPASRSHVQDKHKDAAQHTACSRPRARAPLTKSTAAESRSGSESERGRRRRRYETLCAGAHALKRHLNQVFRKQTSEQQTKQGLLSQQLQAHSEGFLINHLVCLSDRQTDRQTDGGVRYSPGEIHRSSCKLSKLKHRIQKRQCAETDI